MSTDLSDYFVRAKEVYSNLLVVDSTNELLKYFTISDGRLSFNSDLEIKIEFMNRFGDKMSLRNSKSFKEYEELLVRTRVGSYIAAVEEELKRIIEN